MGYNVPMNEVMIMATKKTTKSKYLTLKVYLKPEDDTELIQTLQQMAVDYNMSLSAVCRLVLLSGTPNLSKGFSMSINSTAGESKITKVSPLRRVSN